METKNNGGINRTVEDILTRRSVRRYTDAPVSDADRELILRAAMAAPSGVNRQPWEFVVIDDKDVLKRLADSLPYAKMVAGAPIAIAVCGNSDRFLDGDDATLWVQDLAAVSENILLSAHALGLGAVWTCLYPHGDRMTPVSEILGLPSSVIPFSLIPVGYPADTHKPMDKWHPDRVHLNRYWTRFTPS